MLDLGLVLGLGLVILVLVDNILIKCSVILHLSS